MGRNRSNFEDRFMKTDFGYRAAIVVGPIDYWSYNRLVYFRICLEHRFTTRKKRSVQLTTLVYDL